jgi:hypothetical protein
MTVRHSEVPSLPSWTLREVAAAVFFIAFLGWQIGLPIYQLFAPRPAQFGWQMFSGRHRPAKLSLLLRNGETRALDPSVYLEVSRGDLRFEWELARHLCRTHSQLAAVRLEPEGKAAMVLPCRP